MFTLLSGLRNECIGGVAERDRCARRSTTRLYQSGLKLLWNLRSGAYSTVGVDDLEEVNQAEFIRSIPRTFVVMI